MFLFSLNAHIQYFPNGLQIEHIQVDLGRGLLRKLHVATFSCVSCPTQGINLIPNQPS
jgi:hypothetical protein